MINKTGGHNWHKAIISRLAVLGVDAYGSTGKSRKHLSPGTLGCIAAGATFEETAELIRGAIEIHLESMREDGDSIPEPTTIAGCVAIPA